MNSIKGFVIVGAVSIIISVLATSLIFSSTISELQTRVDRVSSVEARIDSLFDAIRINNDKQQDRIDGISDAVSANNAEQIAKLDALEGAITDLELAVDQKINSKLATEFAEISNVRRDIDTALANERTRTASDISQLETKLAILEDEITSWRSRPCWNQPPFYYNYDAVAEVTVNSYDGLTAYDTQTMRGVVYILVTNPSYYRLETVRLTVTLQSSALPSVRYATITNSPSWSRNGNSLVFPDIITTLEPLESKMLRCGVGIEFTDTVEYVSFIPKVSVQ